MIQTLPQSVSNPSLSVYVQCTFSIHHDIQYANQFSILIPFTSNFKTLNAQIFEKKNCLLNASRIHRYLYSQQYEYSSVYTFPFSFISNLKILNIRLLSSIERKDCLRNTGRISSPSLQCKYSCTHF